MLIILIMLDFDGETEMMLRGVLKDEYMFIIWSAIIGWLWELFM